jgi:PAS domain S-box-containing protein
VHDQPNAQAQLVQARASLRASEDRFRRLVEAVRDYAIYLLDPNGTIASWNAGAERIKGYDASEIIGRHVSIFYTEEARSSRSWERELEVAAREDRFEDEAWRVRKDGSRFWANIVTTPLRDDHRKLIGFATVTRDLTERRQVEDTRLRLAQESAGREAAERGLSLLLRLERLTGALAGARTPDEVEAILVEEAGRALDTVITVLFRPRGDRLDVVASRGATEALVAVMSGLPKEADTPQGVAYRSREPQWVESPEEYVRRFPDVADVAPNRGGVVALPLTVGERVLGVLGFRFSEARVFREDERALMHTWAAHAAQAIERVDSYMREIAAKALAERLQLSLSATLRSIGDAVITTDANGVVTMMNPVAERLTGWSEVEATGRPLTDVFRIIGEKKRDTVANPVAKVLESGVVVGLANHTILIARDGREIPIDDSGALIRREGERIEGVVLVFRDVTEKKRVEARAVFLADATAALAASLDYAVTLGNVARLAVPVVADLCAVDVVEEGDVQPKRVAVHHADPERVRTAEELAARYPVPLEATTGVVNVLRTGQSELYATISDALLVSHAVDEEHRRLLRALSPRSAMIVPLIAHGRVLGAMTFVISESARVYEESDVRFAEEIARRSAIAIENARLYASEQNARKSADVANRAKDEFLAVVSHELRTPLNAIMGWSNMLLTSSSDESRRVRGLETIERNAVAMAQLIDDILDMSRVISGKMRLDVQAVQLDRIVEAAIESIKPAVEAKQLQVGSTIEPDVPPIIGDPARLQQVIWNVLSNAVKFTLRGGRVDVDVRRKGSVVQVAIRDTGKGIAPEFLPHIFEPFRQEDASYTRSRGGLGLGLAITRQLVELHGGRIEVFSAGDRQGATFTVSLPVSAVSRLEESPRAARFRAQAKRVTEPPAELKGLRLLVVDDDPDARLLLRELLEDCGCKVRLAASADEALSELAAEPPDVLLSDIGMPKRDGYDLIRQVRALPPDRGGDVPAAALTAYTSAEDRRRLLNAGYSMHVPKPVDPAELIAIVATLCRFTHRSRASA